MDIQVLNDIANLARQASFSKVGAPVSANTQLKGLKGNPVPAPGNPAPIAVEDSPEQTQAPVAPDISSVARAASAYSAAVGDGLNSDELRAIQDLSGKVRRVVSDFLSQPGLEQAGNAATVVASHPETIQDLTANVEQAVAATLNLPEIEGKAIVNAIPPNTDLLEEIPAQEQFISIERITHGAGPNHPAVAASPALQNAQAGGNAQVETPVSRPDVIASPQQEPVRRSETVPNNQSGVSVAAASPALKNANAQSRVVENPVDAENIRATSSRDFTVTAASLALQNAQAGDHTRAETPVSQPDAVDIPQQEPVIRPETVAANRQETPVTAASPALQNAQAGGNAQVETPVSRPDAVAVPQQEPVAVRSETAPANPQEAPVIAASPALQNTNAQSRVVEDSVNTSEASNRSFRVTAASPALQNSQAVDHAPIETPVSRPDAVDIPQQEFVSSPETVAVNPQETPVSRPDAFVTTQQEPVTRPETVAANRQETPVTAASPALQNAQAQNATVANPVNIPAFSVGQGQRFAEAQTQPVNPKEVIASPAGTHSQAVPEQSNSQQVPGQSNPQPAPVPQSGSAQSRDLFAQDNAAVNPKNIRNVNELVNSVVDNEFTSEAKKIFSEPKVIRTVADLADFILERIREIIAAQQQQSQSSDEVGIS
jgi:hypothetical protein